VEKEGDLCERKNGNGVDPNRNWGVDWGKVEKDYKPSEEAPGTNAFSEPETILLRDVAAHFRPHVWIGVHSGALVLLSHSTISCLSAVIASWLRLVESRCQYQSHDMHGDA
jgi:hypothetical protein